MSTLALEVYNDIDADICNCEDDIHARMESNKVNQVIDNLGINRYSFFKASKKFDRVHVGGVSSMDYFYDETDANEKLIKHGVLALEMEANQLYSIAARKGKKALAVLTVSDHVITHEAMDADARERTLNDMVEVALSALSKG